LEESAVDEKVRERSQRTYLRYIFFKVSREWRMEDEVTREGARKEFLNALNKKADGLAMRFYSLVGTRGDTDFMIWVLSRDLEAIQSLVADLISTQLGRYLEIPYSYLAMSKGSTYLRSHRHEGQEGATAERVPGNSKYLFVYPFVKKREWYKIPFTDRQRIMAEHFKIGHKYPKIKINTGYSFGLDDQEFVLAFEADSPAEFLDLVEELRSSDASKYTERETPIFTCIAVAPTAMLKLVG